MAMMSFMAVALLILCLSPLGAADGDGAAPLDDGGDGLLGTWRRKGFPDGYCQLKHLTPTHVSWVIYKSKKGSLVGTAGGTWSIRDGTYRETYQYAAFSWRHLRGKEVVFSSKLEGDTWSIRGRLDTGFLIDETWEREGT